ncbi:MAG TPA: class I SAM-dependent methyltransferase [Acidimicrobiales bacterium]|nr:class I SAM-dependent methyltransferase [Acidimicrobiales bacterium]
MGDERRRRTLERSRLFDQEAERYDRCRPRYPDVVIDELLGPEPSGLELLDVGCGTGIAARPMAERGAKVLGVELAPRMAEIARRHGIDVEIGAFEDWDAAGRSFDRVTSAQAWHWLDMPAATAKAASILRPNGSLGLIWNGGAHPDDLADALEDVYSTVVPSGTHRLFRGYAAHRSTDVRAGLTGVVDAVTAAPDFGTVTGRSVTKEMNGLSCSCHPANTPPSSRTFDTVCSMPWQRRSTTTEARSSWTSRRF